MAVQEGPSPARLPFADVATTGSLAAVAFALAISLLLVVKLGSIASLVLTAALMAAVLFGPTHGLLAAAAAFVAWRLHAGRAGIQLETQAIEAGLIALVAVAVPWGGRSIAVARRRRAAGGTPLPDGARAYGLLVDFVRRRTFDFSWRLTLRETRRGFIPFLILAAGGLFSLLVRDPVGPAASLLTMLVAVLCTAGVLGARYGFASGVLAAVLLNDLIAPVPGAAIPSASGALMNLVIFAAVGLSVGALADGLQRKRNALKVLVTASREISATTDEAVIHRALFDSLSKLTHRNWIETRDDGGAIRLVSPAADAPPAPRAGEDIAEGWRRRPLIADGRVVGAVRWRYRGLETDVEIADEIAASLIDLGAAAIVRSRLSLEKSEMEFVARAEHLRTILLDAVSHHFRSPLAGILGSVTSVLNLPEQHDREMRRELLLIIKEQANRLSRYVDNFLSVARLESGSIDINRADVLLEPLIYDVWETFGEAGGARRFLQVNVDPRPVRADPSLLAQVLGNVLENAIKFSPEGSIVDVRSRREGDKLVLEVTDQGVGVQAGSEDHIFRRFFRNPGAKAPGLGLGLYIARSLLEMQGGTVAARNRTDGESGLRVELVLPVVGEAT
ncbi:MAG TPA: ATP-binding protein [Phenylobacterium sp.]|nr:ATP-binding protein [Phenylobacterium sp.]